MTDRPMQDLVVGRITGAVGLKGWLKLQSFTDPAENIVQYGELTMECSGERRALEIDGSRVQGKGLAVHVVGIDDRNAAEELGKGNIVMPAASLPQLDDEEYYWHQLEGLKVVLEQDVEVVLGVVDHLMSTGANDVLAVLPCDGSRDGKKRLIPYLPDSVVKRVDVIAGQIEVDWDPDF